MQEGRSKEAEGRREESFYSKLLNLFLSGELFLPRCTRKGAGCKLLSAMKVVDPPLLVKRPPPKKLVGTPVVRKAVKATVPSSLSAGGDRNVPNVPDGPLSSAIAIVVVAPPLPVKMPWPPVSRLVRKATVPRLLITG